MHGYEELKRMQDSIKHMETQIQQSIADSIVIVNSEEADIEQPLTFTKRAPKLKYSKTVKPYE